MPKNTVAGPLIDIRFQYYLLFFSDPKISRRTKDLRFCQITGFIPIFFHIFSTYSVEKLLSLIFLSKSDDKNKNVIDRVSGRSLGFKNGTH